MSVTGDKHLRCSFCGKSKDSVKKFISGPSVYICNECVSPCNEILAEEEELGDDGIVSIESGDPICSAASLFSMEDYTIIAMTEPELFHRLLQRFARTFFPRCEQTAHALPGRLWRIFGPEYAAPPYLPPRLFEEYVVRYVEPMVRLIQKHSGYARIHSHGRLREVLELTGTQKREPLSVVLGKDVVGRPVSVDLASLPHLLVAGSTGSGKSVCLNAIISNLLLNNDPSTLRLCLIDPKMLEMNVYNGIPHLLLPVVTDPREALKAIQWMVAQMEHRYRQLAKWSVRNIQQYNAKIEAGLPSAFDIRSRTSARTALLSQPNSNSITMLA